MSVYIHIHMCVCIYIYMYIYIHMYICIFTHIYTHTHRYAYIDTHIHMYVHIYSHPHDTAAGQVLYKRTLASDPAHVDTLTNYAALLHTRAAASLMPRPQVNPKPST